VYRLICHGTTTVISLILSSLKEFNLP